MPHRTPASGRPDALSRPLRVGLWCTVSSSTLALSIHPTDGIGVFTHNLVRGLLSLPQPPEVLIHCLADDYRSLRAFYARDAVKPRFVFVPVPRGAEVGRVPSWMRSLDRMRDWDSRAADQAQALRARARAWVGRWLLPIIDEGQTWQFALTLAILPFLSVLIWVAFALYITAANGTRLVKSPVRWGSRLLTRIHRRVLRRQAAEEADLVVAKSECNVWIVPSLHCDFPFPDDCRSVLFIHDLITSHFPDLFEPAFIARVEHLSQYGAERATLVTCLSRFIRDNDLRGVLGLPDHKVRMFLSATPADLPELTATEVRLLRPKQLRRPYLFYATALRPHKNIGALVQALRLLRDRHDVHEFDIVLTGGAPGQLPSEIEKLVAAHGLTGRVHVLGGLDRRTLSALYRGAFATIVTSLYEQASFQISEALSCGCPVACSNIPAFTDQCAPLGDAMIYFDPHCPEAIAEAVLRLRENREAYRQRQVERFRGIHKRTWDQVARDCLEVLHAAIALPSAPSATRLSVFAEPAPRLRVQLFLQTFYLGGVWEAAKTLALSLVEVNRRRGQLDLILGVSPKQKDLDELRGLEPELRLEPLELDIVTRSRARVLMGGAHPALDCSPTGEFALPRSPSARQVDAWFALVDRFTHPLLPYRPYGVIVHDMLHKHVPETFNPIIFKYLDEGIRPTIDQARLIMTTSTATWQDVVDEYGVNPATVRLVPVAYEPHRRFAGLAPEHVPVPEPFILNPTNAAAHKGAVSLLRAYSRLRARLGAQTPALVLCGHNTEGFAPDYAGKLDDKYWESIRELVEGLELEVGRDLFLLGRVEDACLADLYQRCAVVVNAALYDNGTYSIIEGHYFGKPVLSARYPAAEFLYGRFGVPVQYFGPRNVPVLARRLEHALHQEPLTGAALAEVRRRLAEPQHSYRRYAEQVYDLLVELAQQGRQERLPSRTCLAA